MKTQTVAVLGSTGSVGTQSLQVIKHLGLRVEALAAAGGNIALLEQQAREFLPSVVAVRDETAAAELKVRLADLPVRVLYGMAGVTEAAAGKADTVLAAMSGAIGLLPALAAIREKKRLALANKETLVCAGAIVMAESKKSGAEIIPVDSEHSAIFQCLAASGGRAPSKILLTASGGPFRGFSQQQLRSVKKEDALRHPNWSMGSKITIDSATLMNKGLEYIEAMHLFGVSPEQITVLVHPQSVVHSMVEFTDGAVLAQCGIADMRLPIQYAFTYPDRAPSLTPAPDFAQIGTLTFEKPDLEAFPCLKIAMETAKKGSAACAVMNAANEEAVGLFLRDKIAFSGIYDCVRDALDKLEDLTATSVEDILDADRQARELVRKAKF